jgi:hypothetical protein
MYKSIDFSSGNTGGFPLTQNKMAFIQDSYNTVLGKLSYAIGNFVIITGVVNDGGGNYSDGWITYDGEIIPFIGAPISQGNRIEITETRETVTYRDTTMRDVVITRTGTFGSTGQLFSSFKRISVESVESIANTALATANAALAAALAASSLPSGVIVNWKGSVATIPLGFALCDGTNGTPDLRDRFVAGAGGSYAVNAIGGSDSVTLDISQIPSHSHTVIDPGHNHAFSGVNPDGRGGDGSKAASIATKNTTPAGTGITIANNGGGGSHENRPPFYALCYIMKL